MIRRPPPPLPPQRVEQRLTLQTAQMGHPLIDRRRLRRGKGTSFNSLIHLTELHCDLMSSDMFCCFYIHITSVAGLGKC